jgi:hypothetical protein
MNWSDLFNITIIGQYLETFNIDTNEYWSGALGIWDWLKFLYFSIFNFDIIDFSDFQRNIARTFCLILIINTCLIVFYWNKYGDIITDRFIRPSKCSHTIEKKLRKNRIALSSPSEKGIGRTCKSSLCLTGTLKEIEELKQSVARLKLPKEHSPRI